MPLSSPLRRQRYDVIAQEVRRGKDLAWKMLSSRSRFAATAYNCLDEAAELVRQLEGDLFRDGAFSAAAERARRLTLRLRDAQQALASLAEEQRIDTDSTAQHVGLALAVLAKLSAEISPEETFEDED